VGRDVKAKTFLTSRDHASAVLLSKHSATLLARAQQTGVNLTELDCVKSCRCPHIVVR